MRKFYTIIRNGILSDNPIFRLALSLCPALAVTTSMNTAFAMGLAVCFVMTGSEVIVSLVKKLVHHKIRVPAYIVIIGSFVTMASLIIRGYYPDLYRDLGIYLSLIVVFTVILARVEVFASKQPVHLAFADGLGMGIGFTFGMLLMAFFRELLGSGSFFGYSVFGPNFQPVLMMMLPPGGFITIGLIMGFINWYEKRKKRNNLTAQGVRSQN